MSRMAAVISSPPQDESCALACRCGWSETVAIGFRTTPVQARARAIERGRAHLREKHGASASLERRLPGNVRELSGINERLLDKSQLDEYRERLTAANFRGGGGAGPKFRMKLRDGARSYLALGLWFVVLVPLVLLMAQEDNKPEPHPDPYLWLMLVCLLLGWIPAVWVLARDAENWRLKLVSRYLDSIHFEQRDPQASRRGYDDNGTYKSNRQMGHEWYGDHSELNWRDREQAQAWGMDADTYVSNWLEHDPD